ncbi:hypothetical protein GW17_00049355 [Ensete ventricosum]|nr:hypothetical protein GW17_00049355 [Ensete ventricosum]RZS03138.1 hypothetical protein BHM03_00033280 [Ensete ventricosum]
MCFCTTKPDPTPIPSRRHASRGGSNQCPPQKPLGHLPSCDWMRLYWAPPITSEVRSALVLMLRRDAKALQEKAAKKAAQAAAGAGGATDSKNKGNAKK